jgi:hypothetical protein
MAHQIASVGNGGSQPRWLFPIFQLVLVSPLLVPVWVAGLWALARDPALRFARAFAVAYAADEHSHAIVLARNYGEAGAVDIFRHWMALPPAYSGHNSYADWGPPPETAHPVIAVGFDEPTLRRMFGSVRLAAKLDNGIGLANDEQGRPVWVCHDRLASWSALWPGLRRLA